MTVDRRPGSPDWEPAAPGTLLAEMALVMKTERHPTGFEDSSEQEVRELFASCWIVQGFTDPREVERWILAGVQAARNAADAVDAGYRPGDPWVETVGPSFVIEERTLRRPGFLQAIRNRRRAAHQWQDEQRRIRVVNRQTADAAMLLDGEGGSPLMVLDLLVDGDPLADRVTPDLIWRALAELDMQLAAPAHADDSLSYWESMVRLINRAAAVCDARDQVRVRTHLLELTEAIAARSAR